MHHQRNRSWPPPTAASCRRRRCCVGTGELLDTVESSREWDAREPVILSRDGRVLLDPQGSQRLRLVDAATGKTLLGSELPFNPWSCALSPDGKAAAVAGRDG